VFDVWAQIVHLSKVMTLEPGDLIFTGTPGGVGLARKPPVFLAAGDTVVCEIAELGMISGVMIQEA
jgi:2-keto-4-pentenoate hydratase/2-oxohepta-3-ene-1,7-dioic acid hydratase in catechol pathway